MFSRSSRTLTIEIQRSFLSHSKSTSVSENGNIGFIGLGNMGLSMARNLLKHADIGGKGSVYVYDINKVTVGTLVAEGAKEGKSVAELSKHCNTIFTMLPATQHVRGTLTGPDGVFKNAPKGALIVDSSTIDPLASKALIAEAKAAGMDMIDAPVSGGVTGAAAGTLTFMVGGTETALERARPFLSAMGKNIVHCGDGGAGEVTKLCNNLSLAISMIGTSEAMGLGIRMGMDPKKLAAVMNTSTARCVRFIL
jgi:3-hydroxyisobutyrate dehydrogenase